MSEETPEPPGPGWMGLVGKDDEAIRQFLREHASDVQITRLVAGAEAFITTPHLEIPPDHDEETCRLCQRRRRYEELWSRFRPIAEGIAEERGLNEQFSIGDGNELYAEEV